MKRPRKKTEVWPDMPECGFCGLEVETVYRCSKCGVPFCSECGSVEDELCLYCLSEEEFKEDIGVV